MPNHALIFGASGISGWALCNQLLAYPSKDSFSRVTGLTNRPLSIEDAKLPHDPRLELLSGIDLSGTVESVKQDLEKKVKDIKDVTHVFFMGTPYV
jgi:nucleoside-diphosphate-sugar epimerase